MEIKTTAFGERLRHERLSREWSVAELARRAKVLSAEAIRQMESGLIVDPKMSSAKALAKALDIALEHLCLD